MKRNDDKGTLGRAALVGLIVAQHDLRDRRQQRRVLDLDHVQRRGSGRAVEHPGLFERGHRLTHKRGTKPAAGVEAEQLGHRALAHRPARVGRALEGLVVQQDRLAILGGLQVVFEPVQSALKRKAQGS